MAGAGSIRVPVGDDAARASPPDAEADPAAYASALHAWLAAGKLLDQPTRHGLTALPVFRSRLFHLSLAVINPARSDGT